MKIKSIFIFMIISVIVIGCVFTNTPASSVEVTIITREVTQNVTRINYIYQTIIPTTTPTSIYSPTKTITPTNQPTPTPSCYDTAETQSDLNACAFTIAQETKKSLQIIVNLIANEFSDNPNKKNEFLELEGKWEELAEQECIVWWGSMPDGWYEYGSMAPMIVYGCFTEKYEKRIVELQELYKEL